MITVSTACLFCNPCARAESHQQERARKLCSATLKVDTKVGTTGGMGLPGVDELELEG